ncbi:carotenoid biosynthesis protein [Anaerococcus sp. NML200537]|uniref:carotenoid biosynthesis protein n=1 Tax=Anaerococcus sp. NML200537 TaxID=2954485 RepID=UPI002237351E|nr:carotenoid biosynthesis protein [Anaerococcus sp. NML200537]MCW6700816.1 carotenoid biosynthesis protein [Anaerococcus sp. NML200537]
MNWINSFELICYFIVLILLLDIIKNKSYRELGLLISGALAGFSLELLAVRLTDIYHYSNDFYISIGFSPYQFPFFGGLMWGGISVVALRIAKKFSLSNIMTALLSGWLIVSMDLLLDVVAIRLDGGFWVWDGRPINLDINHHMFMSVIWVNFLGYMFEVPSIIYMTLKSWEKDHKDEKMKLSRSILIGFGGVAFVGVSSYISLLLNKITDEWFAYLAFLAIWIFVLMKLLAYLMNKRKDIIISHKKDWTVIIFWFCIYTYCIGGLFKLGIIQELPLYGIFSFILFILTIVLAIVEIKDKSKALK